jgi:polar amino acid transport system substrate-binding protein
MLTDLALVDKTVLDNPKTYVRAYGVVSGFQIGVAVKKGNAALETALLDAITALQKDGVQKAIFTEYGVDPSLALPAALKTN